MTRRHFPHELYLVHHLPTNSYGCAFLESAHGLACFSRAAGAHKFAGRIETRENLIVSVTMADACEIAEQAGLDCLILADSPSVPAIHALGSPRQARG